RPSAGAPSNSPSRAWPSGTSSTSSSAATRPSARSPHRTLCCSRSTGSARARIRPRTSATRPSTCRPHTPRACTPSAAPAAASTQSASQGAESTSVTHSPTPTSSSTPRRSSLPSSKTQPAARVAELRDLLNRWSYEYHALDEPTVDDPTYDRHYDELVELEAD